jgi:hypothetical protein
MSMIAHYSLVYKIAICHFSGGKVELIWRIPLNICRYPNCPGLLQLEFTLDIPDALA